MFITQRAQALVSGTKNISRYYIYIVSRYIFIYQKQVPVIHSLNGTSTIYIVYTYWTLSIFCRLYDTPPFLCQNTINPPEMCGFSSNILVLKMFLFLNFPELLFLWFENKLCTKILSKYIPSLQKRL